jgi:hypothetical protein
MCKSNDPLHSKLVVEPKSDHAHLHAHDTISARLRLAISINMHVVKVYIKI